MTRPRTLLLVAALALGAGASAAAHHGAAGLFDTTRTVEVRGMVMTWSFVNPHPILVLEVADAEGQTAEWDIYFGPSAAAALSRRGYAADTFRVGEALVVRGHPARAADILGLDVFGRDGLITREDGTRVP